MKTERTTPSRHADRVSYDRQAAYQVLDEASICHLGFIAGGAPRVLPTLFARVGDTLYVHGSTGGGPAFAAREQATMCVTVTLLDGWVLGRSQFHHSANFRSVVVYAVPRLVRDEAEKRAALSALVDRVAPGRSADSRPPTAKELAGTAVLALLLPRDAGDLDGADHPGEVKRLQAQYPLARFRAALFADRRVQRRRLGPGVASPATGADLLVAFEAVPFPLLRQQGHPVAHVPGLYPRQVGIEEREAAFGHGQRVR